MKGDDDEEMKAIRRATRNAVARWLPTSAQGSQSSDRERYWRSASRYRQLSTLFTEFGAAARLRAISNSIEMELANGQAMSALAEHMISRSKVLCGEIETLLMRARAAREGAPFYVSPTVYRIDHMREEARLCREEAEATDHPEAKRRIAAAAFSLAQLAEAIERGRSP